MILRNNLFEIIDEIDINDVDVNEIKGFLKEISLKEIEDIDDDIIENTLSSMINNEIYVVIDNNKNVNIEIDEIIKHYLLNIVDDNDLFNFYTSLNISIDYYFKDYNDFYDMLDHLNIIEIKLNHLITNLNNDFFEKINNRNDLFENYYYYKNNKINVISFNEIIEDIKENIDEIIKTMIYEDEIDLIKELI